MAGRVLWMTVLAWIVVGCALSFPCRADDAEDAVELLYALSEVSPKARRVKVDGERRTIISHTISKYLGDSRKLVLAEETTYDTGRVFTWTRTANFADLDMKYIERNGNSVSLQCLENRGECITVKSKGQKPTKSSFMGIDVCNSATAERTKLAIETLTKLSKESPAR